MTYQMIDEEVVAVSPSSVYRVLKDAGRLRSKPSDGSLKGTGFVQPLAPHEHWHTDVAYLNICGTFYYLCAVIDGYSRYVVAWDLRESMTEADIELVLQRGREQFPGHATRVISDNGPQFISKDFKQFIRIAGMQHVRTSPYYPQSNGKCERWWLTSKTAIRSRTPLSVEDARNILTDFVSYYNRVRLHSSLDYVTPQVKLEGRADAVIVERKRKLADARIRRLAFRGIAA
jgi:transposase InsO family protein